MALKSHVTFLYMNSANGRVPRTVVAKSGTVVFPIVRPVNRCVSLSLEVYSERDRFARIYISNIPFCPVIIY